MASVHLAKMRGPEGFSKIVAIKRMHPQRMSESDGATQLLDEARMAARISHPNVVSTLDIVVNENEVLLVMEYVHGESLAHLVGNESKVLLPVPIAVGIIIDGLHGLHAAHEATTEDGLLMGLVHRDISPQNLMVGADGITKVADFGIAKAVMSSDETTQKVVKGKLGYMAPEQVQCQPVSRRTDVFAAAISLWEVLTGRRLFKGDSHAATVHKVMVMPIPPPSQFRREVPPELDKVLLKGLARDPEHRYQTAREMALALEAAVAPVRASQIAACVAQLVGPSLEARKQLIAEIEGGASSAAPSWAPPQHLSPFSDDDRNIKTVTGRSEVTRSSSASGARSSWGAETEIPETSRDSPSNPPHFASPGSSAGSFPLARAGLNSGRRKLTAFLWIAPLGVALVVAGYFWLLTSAESERPEEMAVDEAPMLGESPSPSPFQRVGPSPVSDSAQDAAAASELSATQEPIGEENEFNDSLDVRPVGVEALQPRPAAAPRPRAPRVPDCDPPFSINAQGHRIFKPECM